MEFIEIWLLQDIPRDMLFMIPLLYYYRFLHISASISIFQWFIWSHAIYESNVAAQLLCEFHGETFSVFRLFVWEYSYLEVLEYFICILALGHYISIFSIFKNFILNLYYNKSIFKIYLKILRISDYNYYLKKTHTNENL